MALAHPADPKPAQETEESKKRRRKDEDLREALQHNSSLAAYSLKLEFMAQDNIRKLKTMKRLFRTHILPFARTLAKQGLRVPRWEEEQDSDSDCEKKAKSH
jgi:hypothetical protein